MSYRPLLSDALRENSGQLGSAYNYPAFLRSTVSDIAHPALGDMGCHSREQVDNEKQYLIADKLEGSDITARLR